MTDEIDNDVVEVGVKRWVLVGRSSFVYVALHDGDNEIDALVDVDIVVVVDTCRPDSLTVASCDGDFAVRDDDDDGVRRLAEDETVIDRRVPIGVCDSDGDLRDFETVGDMVMDCEEVNVSDCDGVWLKRVRDNVTVIERVLDRTPAVGDLVDDNAMDGDRMERVSVLDTEVDTEDSVPTRDFVSATVVVNTIDIEYDVCSVRSQRHPVNVSVALNNGPQLPV